MLVARRTKLLAIAAALALAASATLLSGLASAAPNPPGNNGTIKVDREPFDTTPGNEPHVGCTFQVDFYGYDEGDLEAQVTFTAHPPTRSPGDDQVLLTDTVDIGEDDNASGGSQAGLDASETYTLDLTGISPHPEQGVHVKLTINAEGSKGADVKHKVFWVTGCPPKPGESTTTTSTTVGKGGKGGKGEEEESTTTTSRAGGAGGAGGEQHAAPTTTTTASEVAGAVEETSSTLGGAAPSTTAGEGLPFTGANTLPTLLVGLALLGLGTAILILRTRPGRT